MKIGGPTDGSIDDCMTKFQVEDMVDSIGVSDVQKYLCISRVDGVSSLGLSASGSTGDLTSTGGFTSDDAGSDGAKKSPSSSTWQQ